ncbi:MAG: SpoVA/SpoVAEb family sporulation membrane protein, partial [Coriobacteriaceae bacterium]|nr:SpoVA/SpoVAEb family sporulation membrane protein [Coriobacteriaceae bacterium]
MKDTVKAIGMAALVGGCFGLVGHALMLAFAMTPAYTEGATMPLVLISLGLIGAVLFLCGIYPKLEEIGGMGAILPFSGLSSAIAGMTFGSGKAQGSAGKGIAAPLVHIFLKAIVPALVVCCAIAAVMKFAGFGGVNAAPYPPAGVAVTMLGPPNGPEGPPAGIPVGIEPISFLWSFISVAVISAVVQAVFMLRTFKMGTFFLGLIVLGGILTPFGIMKMAVQFGGGGVEMLIIDAGEAMVATFYALLSGHPVPFLSLLGVIVFIFILGIGAGLIKLATDARKGQ